MFWMKNKKFANGPYSRFTLFCKVVCFVAFWQRCVLLLRQLHLVTNRVELCRWWNFVDIYDLLFKSNFFVKKVLKNLMQNATIIEKWSVCFSYLYTKNIDCCENVFLQRILKYWVKSEHDQWRTGRGNDGKTRCRLFVSDLGNDDGLYGL